MKELIFGISIVLFTTIIGCNSKKAEISGTSDVEKDTVSYDDLLLGNWVEQNPITQNEVQGIEIKQGGEAKSINMATLLYENWWMEDDTLYLVSKSIGNHNSSTDTIPYKINILNKNQLILSDRDLIITYRKQ